MTKQKKLLLVAGLIFTPVLGLIAVILRAAALFAEFDKDTGYYIASPVLRTAFLWVAAVAVLAFLLLALFCRKDLPAPAYQNSLSVLFSAAFFIVALAVGTLFSFMSVPAATSSLAGFFWVMAALSALLSLLYFALFFKGSEAAGNRHGLLGLAPAFFSLFTAMLLYFDRSIQMNAPAKFLQMLAFLLLACYFTAESRCLLGRACRPLYCFLASVTLFFASAASIPNLLYHLVERKTLVLSVVYDFILLAAALYTLARLLQLLPYERPLVHKMVEALLRREAEATAETAEAPTEEKAEETPAPILPMPGGEEGEIMIHEDMTP